MSGWLTALGAGMSAGGAALSQHQKPPRLMDLRTKEQKAATSFLESLYRAPAPEYPVAPVADLSRQEQDAIAMAERYAASTPEGTDYLRNVLGESGNILEIPEYRALFDELTKEGSLEANRLGRSLQLRGGTASSAGRDMLGRLLSDIQGRTMSAMAPYASAERSRKMAAAETLNRLGEQSILNRLNALSSAGSVQRQLEQLRQTAEYEQQMNALNFDYERRAPLAASIMGTSGDWLAYPANNIQQRWGAALSAIGPGLMNMGMSS